MNARATLFIGLATSACTELPTVEPDVCGNAVLEASEQCDTFADGNTACGVPGTPGACRFICTPGEPSPACPDGLGCGLDGVCREATGQFGPAAFSGDFLASASQVRLADVDGDTHDDLIAFTLAGVSVRFGTGDGRFVDEFEFPLPLSGAEADVADVNGDARADVLVPVDSGALVLLGQADRALVPAPFLQAVGSGDIARVRGARPPADPDQHAAVLVGPFDGGTFIALEALDLDAFTEAALPIPFGASRPGLALARDDTFNELYAAVGFTGSAPIAVARFDVVASCEDACWDDQEVSVLRLDPPSLPNARLVSLRARQTPADGVWAPEPAIAIAPVADTPALDVVALYADGTGTRRLVVWPGPTFTDPFVVGPTNRGRLTVEISAQAFPLAVADLDLDGQPDVVRPDGVWSSDLRTVTVRPQLEPWTEALLVDLNDDGLLDIAAASVFIEGVDVFFGTGLPLFNRSRIDTSASIARLAAGDFNGDFVGDLLIAERTFEDVGGDASTLFLVPGKLQGVPGPKITVGKLSYIQDLIPFYFPGLEFDFVQDVLVHSSPEPDGQGDALIAFLQGSTDGRLVSFLAVGESDANIQAIRAGRLETGGSDAVDLLVARRTANSDLSAESDFVVVGGDGSGVYSSSDERPLALDACTRGFDLQTSTIEVAPLQGSDDVESLFIIDKAPCGGEECLATLVVSRGGGSTNECWWSELPGPTGGVPTDMIVADLDRNGVRELLVAYGFDATPVRGGVFKDAATAARQTGLAIYWDLDEGAYTGGSGAVSGDEAFGAGEVYTPATSALTPAEEIQPGADGFGEAGQLAGVRSIALIQGDADVAPEILVLASDGLFLAELEKPGLRLVELDIPIEPGIAIQSVVAGDVNGDGVDDVVVTQGDRFQVYFGIGRGEERR